ncbi:hypothetical protein SKAU_G00138770 [Synaphobranchus kaupii]|uniref:Uncharacterized protein n=1 Tax=Synaphobranchus kaupii TaxID=118154 RepID=A0A9Q1J3S7_SYNKA|nr:hypothetical protein SKAU_G00138770 [Synaphobranchus kaupii]
MENQGVFMSAADLKRGNLGKKRKRYVNEWKDKRQKALRNAGKPYTSRKGVEKEGKTPPKKGKICADTCPKECSKLTERRKLQLFTEFYKVPYEQQQAIILSGLEQHKVIRRRSRARDPEVTVSKRNFTYRYHLQQGGQRLSVCKPTFMSVYQLTNSRLQTTPHSFFSDSGDKGTYPLFSTSAEPLHSYEGECGERIFESRS